MRIVISLLASLFVLAAFAAEESIELRIEQSQDQLSGESESIVLGVGQKFVVVFTVNEGNQMVYVQPIESLVVFDQLGEAQCRWMFAGESPKKTPCYSDLRKLGFLNPGWASSLADGKSLRIEVRSSEGTDILVIDAGHLKTLLGELEE